MVLFNDVLSLVNLGIFCEFSLICFFFLSNVKVGHKRIFLFTNEDNPNANNKQLRDRSFQRAKDLNELNIDIELFSMNKLNKPFDPTLFYQVNSYIYFFKKFLRIFT